MRRLETFVLSFSLAGPRARQYALERCFELQGGVGFEAYMKAALVSLYATAVPRADEMMIYEPQDITDWT
jgi:hypothetical protein